MRRKLRHRQRSRRRRNYRRFTRKQRGGELPVPRGAVVAISTGGEYGIPVLMNYSIQPSGKMKENRRMLKQLADELGRKLVYIPPQ